MPAGAELDVNLVHFKFLQILTCRSKVPCVVRYVSDHQMEISKLVLSDGELFTPAGPTVLYFP